MSGLYDLLRRYVDDGTVPGAVALVARGGRTETVAAGTFEFGGGSPMRQDTLFRLASITKPVMAAALLTLVDEGRLALDEPVKGWLPELAAPRVVRTPEADPDDVVPARRDVTVEDLLTSRAGHGFPEDFSLPAVQQLFGTLQKSGLDPRYTPAPDEWMDRLSRIPMVRQPGEAWLYNTASDVQGVLAARVSGQPLPEFLAERVLEPLGMTDTAFWVPAGRLDRLPTFYRPGAEGVPEVMDPPDGQWSEPPAFPSGAGGLVSTARDWLAFARMLLAGGTAEGRRVLSEEAVLRMTTDHLTPGQRASCGLFLEGQGWGYGGSVDVERVRPWNVPGRYGWVGGSGTSAHLVPADGTVSVLLTQMAMTGPTPPALMRDFWQLTAAA
ncbi:serine hydrolase domain-containing protein [Streptomyces sp. NPDC051051]|uniref:serine hydrolase domain-containing protein n=1 Tax=Streptomyces sp. NPDC051051 TaxID=3155666 RepID=UPI00343AF381